jgi:lipoyl(octanoyl) transferase
VATDLRNFELIVPCGIADRKATSLEKLLSRGVTIDEVRPHLAKHFCELFASNPRWMARQELQKLLVEAEASVSIS